MMMLTCCGQEIQVSGRLLRIARLDGDKYTFLDDPEPVLDGLRKCGKRIDLFTFMQKPPETSPRFCYPMDWDNFAALPISTFDEWWTQQVNNKIRNMVRKAEKKGVELREVPFDDMLARGIHAIYNESPIRQGRRFPHYGKDLETVRKISATFPDQSIFIGAFSEGDLIGFVKLVIDESRTQAGIMHILSMVRHRDKAPTNALIAQAVRSCAERGIRYLCYGNFSYGRRQHDSLSNFKVSNGFQKIELPRYYVPLTAAGRAALRLGLHRHLIDWVPEPIAATYRRIRKSWYAKGLPSLRNA